MDRIQQGHAVFPHWYAASRFQTHPLWRSDSRRIYDPQFDGLLQLVDLEVATALRRPDSVEAARAVALAIITDAHLLAHQTSSHRERLAPLLLGITAAVPLAERYLELGQIRDCVELLMQPLRDERGSTRTALGELTTLLSRDQITAQVNGASRLARLLRLLFVTDRFTSWLREQCQSLAPAVDDWAARWMKLDWQTAVPVALEFEHWAIQVARPNPSSGQILHRMAEEGALDDHAVACVAYLSVLRKHLEREAGVRPAAQVAATSHAANLTKTQLLHLLSIAFEHTEEVGDAEFDQLIEAIVACMADWAIRTPDPAILAERRGLHWRIMGPVLYRLVADGQAERIATALGTWIGLEPSEVRHDVLFFVLSIYHQAGWVFRSSAALGQPPVSLDELIQVTGLMRGESRWLEDSPAPPPEPIRAGVPNEGYAERAVALMGNSLMRDRLAAVLEASDLDSPGCMVPLPYFGVSTQPVMIQELDQSFPWCVSFRNPLPDSLISRAAVIWTDTGFAQLEAAGIAQVLQQAGVATDLVIDDTLDREQFLAIYSDPEVDLIWLAGHARFDGNRPERSEISLPSGRSAISPGDLRAHVPPRARRRLLVMNVCDAAAALMHGGVPEFGLAPMAADPRQAVVGHAWSIPGWPYGSLFGRVLAGELVRDSSAYFRAFESTMRVLQEGSPAVLQRLDGSAGELDRLLAGAAHAHTGAKPVAYTEWGSAAFLE